MSVVGSETTDWRGNDVINSDLIVQGHVIDVAASAHDVYDLVVKTDRWPFIFSPTIHVEREDLPEGEERLRLWAFANGVVRNWTSRRSLDPEGLRVWFQQEMPAPPLEHMAGEWKITSLSDNQAHVELLHSFRIAGDDQKVAWAKQATDRNSVAELAALRDTVEKGRQFQDTVVSFTDKVLVNADPERIYDFLHRVDLWPTRVPHVARLDLTEVDSATQMIEMDTCSSNGSMHTTRSVRICFPESRTIVYKQTSPPDLLSSHVGRWTVRGTDSGVEASSQHTAVIRPEKIAEVLGEGATVEQARQTVRRLLGANSMTTLECAKAAVEHVVV
jgi:aromatase